MHGLHKYSTLRVSNHFFSINDINNLSSRDYKLYYITLTPINTLVKKPLKFSSIRDFLKNCVHAVLFLTKTLLSKVDFSKLIQRFLNTQDESFQLRSLTIENIIIPCFNCNVCGTRFFGTRQEIS